MRVLLIAKPLNDFSTYRLFQEPRFQRILPIHFAKPDLFVLFVKMSMRTLNCDNQRTRIKLPVLVQVIIPVLAHIRRIESLLSISVRLLFFYLQFVFNCVLVDPGKRLSNVAAELLPSDETHFCRQCPHVVHTTRTLEQSRATGRDHSDRQQ